MQFNPVANPTPQSLGLFDGHKVGIFLDTETTGLSATKHRILEIAFRVVDLFSGKEHARFEAVIKQPDEVWEKASPQALEINGFTKEKVTHGISETEVAQQVTKVFQELGITGKNSVFVCQNPSFDRPFFSQLIDEDTRNGHKWPYHWLDFASMYYGAKIATATPEKALEVLLGSLSKDTIATNNNLPAEERPHRAMNGVDHLLLLFGKIIGFPGSRVEVVEQAELEGPVAAKMVN